jgi:hypothetical protein
MHDIKIHATRPALPSASHIPGPASARARRLRRLIVLAAAPVALLAGLWAACGGDGGSGPGDPKRGYVACGSVTCNPGQHCDNLLCIAGCQSNDNCASDQTCTSIDTTTHIGTCQNQSAPDMAPPADSLTRCKNSCLKMVTCNLISVNEGSGCQTDCSSYTDTQRGTFATCVEQWSCDTDPVPACLSPIQCGGNYTCAVGQNCVGHKCL